MKLKARAAKIKAIPLVLFDISPEKHEYVATGARDRNQTFKGVDVKNFDLVITDLQMVQTKGFDTILTTKNTIYQGIGVLITRCYKKLQESDIFRSGVNDFGHKPFSIRDMFERIRLLKLKGSAPSVPPLETIQKTKKCQEYFQTVNRILYWNSIIDCGEIGSCLRDE